MLAKFETLLAVVCFIGIMTMNTATHQEAGHKNNLLKLNHFATLALRKAKEIYCQNVPRLINTSCDQFIDMVTNETTIHLPQMILPEKINIDNEKNVLINMRTTINEYLILVRWGIDEECKIFYGSTKDFKCISANICKNDDNGDKAIFYCRLHVVYKFLEHFRNYLESTIASNTAPIMVEQLILPPKLKNVLYVRWFLMKILDTSLKQMSIFEKINVSGFEQAKQC